MSGSCLRMPSGRQTLCRKGDGRWLYHPQAAQLIKRWSFLALTVLYAFRVGRSWHGNIWAKDSLRHRPQGRPWMPRISPAG